MGMWITLLQIVLAWIATDYLITLLKRSKLNPKRQPPSPFPLLIIGNLLSIGAKPHRSFAGLTRAHGPAMLLKLGSSYALVVSSASVAKDVLRTNDLAFSGRNVMHTTTAADHHLSSVVFLPPNARWKAFRRICTTLVFTNSRLAAAQGIRSKMIRQLINHVEKCSKIGAAVNIGEAAFVTIMNTLTNTIFSMDLVDHGLESATSLKELVWLTLEVASVRSISDFFPTIKKLDLQRNKRRAIGYLRNMIQIFDRVITRRLEHRREVATKSDGLRYNDVLDDLLDLSDDPANKLTHSDIHHLLIDLFIAGTETISGTTEWAMTELFRHKEKMCKAKEELEQVIGDTSNPVQETDISQLPYLRAIIKETFRLHPPTPFLVPREVFTDTKLNKFTIPKNTKVLVNIWAIGRDPMVWENADVFEPERFLGSSIDFRGQDFELIPFGSGRRMCVGVALASKMLHLMVGSFIHSVNTWKLENGMEPKDINMEEKFGFGLQKAKPMLAIPVKEIESDLTELLYTCDECTHFPTVLQSTKNIYELGPQLTDFNQLFDKEITKLKTCSSSKG